VFAGIAAFIAQKPELVEKTATTFQFNFKDPDSTFFIDLKTAPGKAGAGTLDKADVTLELPTKHLQTLFGGDMAAVQKLYFGGELKISGNIMASNKLGVLKGMDPALVTQARDKRLKGSATAPAAAVPAASASAKPAAPKASQAGELLAALTQKLAKASGLSGVVQFNVRDPESVWTLDLSANPPKASNGANNAAKAVVTLNDGALADLLAGKRTLRSLYQKGDLRVDGDVSLLRQIEQAL
jgi:3-hydroxyacyl-CoA dehydrogenase/3a,7a,12a-trihydroxy-5b-cholest-24-enoyl-CoA hydratase